MNTSVHAGSANTSGWVNPLSRINLHNRVYVSPYPQPTGTIGFDDSTSAMPLLENTCPPPTTLEGLTPSNNFFLPQYREHYGFDGNQNGENNVQAFDNQDLNSSGLGVQDLHPSPRLATTTTRL